MSSSAPQPRDTLVRVRLPKHLAKLMREEGKVECACFRWFRPFGDVTKCEDCDPDAWVDEKRRRDEDAVTYMLHAFLHSGLTAKAEASGWMPPGTVEAHRRLLREAGIDPDADPRDGRAAAKEPK